MQLKKLINFKVKFNLMIIKKILDYKNKILKLKYKKIKNICLIRKEIINFNNQFIKSIAINKIIH